MWLITNKILDREIYERYSFLTFSGFQLITDQSISSDFDKKLYWIFEGYALSNSSDQSYRKSKFQPEDLELLYLKFKSEFINHISGNFVIIKINQNGFTIHSDPFALRKFFIWTINNEFIISNSLKEISKLVNLTPSVLNMSLYAVLYHFTGGRTLFGDVRHNQPGEVVEYEGGRMVFRRYWHPQNLLSSEVDNLTIGLLTDKIKSFISGTMPEKDKISLSLTGGGDTRNLLAAFLSLGIEPHLYTYGNLASNDCVKASKIAAGLRLEHDVHDFKMDKQTFEKKAREIVLLGNSLASIHRVHRLMAVEKEKVHADYMYLGSLGGEFVKGVCEDDYIVPSIVYQHWSLNNLAPTLVNHYLTIKRIIIRNEILNEITELINDEPFMKGDIITRKINALSFITAHLHDAQDINLYRSVMKEVYTPFLDLNYLKSLFSSRFNFSIKEHISNRHIKRINNPVYSSKFVRETFPALLEYRYSGEHKPSEVLFNKYYAALMKTFRQRKKASYPPNFPLGKWMEDFISDNLPACYDYRVLRESFDLDQLRKDLRNNSHYPIESYWLKFSNPVMMRFIIEEFSNA